MESADGVYVGVNTRNKAGQIRVLSITDLQFVSLADIILRNRIFEWNRLGDR